MRLNLGAGRDIQNGWVNVDYLALPGIDVVHNLAIYPWPFQDESVEEIRAIDIIEHMPSHTRDLRPGVIAFIEQSYRILIPGGKILIQTPGHRAEFAWTDPTHVRTFTRDSFTFFDPAQPFGMKDGFYSHAKFSVNVDEMENGNLKIWMDKL
jgi:cyclopropane fatty-acyl-phospholipid synthase-like methyltransferase